MFLKSILPLINFSIFLSINICKTLTKQPVYVHKLQTSIILKFFYTEEFRSDPQISVFIQ